MQAQVTSFDCPASIKPLAPFYQRPPEVATPKFAKFARFAMRVDESLSGYIGPPPLGSILRMSSEARNASGTTVVLQA
jgi:hypothetical protein